MQSEKEQIVVTGVGMVCSLGLDAGTACAAARAGFSGAAELSFKITNLEKIYRTEEVETVALNKLSFEVKEGEFVAVAVKVFLADLVERTVVAALQQAEERFGRVRVDDNAVRAEMDRACPPQPRRACGGAARPTVDVGSLRSGQRT